MNLSQRGKKRMRFSLLAIAGAMLWPSLGAAQTVFMVQLGTFDTEAKARTHWERVSAALPGVFDSLSYVPGELVVRPDDFVSYRTQAGPIESREKAEELCGEVSGQGYECYVVETAMFSADDDEVQNAGTITTPETLEEAPTSFAAAPVEVATPSEVPAPVVAAPPPAQAPVVAPAPAAPAQTYAETTSVHVGASPVVAQATPAGTAAGDGEIAVEEAIPVPLSDNAPAANPYLERGNTLMNASPSDATRVSSYWADVGYFTTDAAAAQYVRVLKSRDSLLPSKLRVRIVRPYASVRGQERLSLRMGPFLSDLPVRRLCALTRPEGLRCRAIKDLGGSVSNTSRYAARAQTQRGSAYQSYGNRAPGAATLARPGSGGAPAAPLAGGGQYYVQLGSFLSARAAQDKWHELQARHGRTLAGQAHQVAQPTGGSSASRLFRLRTGPYSSYQQAGTVCSALRAQGTLCIVAGR